MSYEYRVIPAPVKGTKAKTAKTAPDRFALTLQETMNAMATEGWEFQRAETLPSEERSGLTGTKTVYHNVLVFRRKSETALAAFNPREMQTSAEEPRPSEQPVPFLRPAFSAVSEPSAKAPPVPSPRAMTGSLVKDTPRDES